VGARDQHVFIIDEISYKDVIIVADKAKNNWGQME
jgi:hypothetical protein